MSNMGDLFNPHMVQEAGCYSPIYRWKDRGREQRSDLPNVVLPGLGPASLRLPSMLIAQGQASACLGAGHETHTLPAGAV